MNRLDRIEEKQKEIEEKIPTKKEKKFRLPWKIKSLGRRSDKLTTSILVQYLTIKGIIEFKICKIISGNIIIIDNKPHELDPECMWRYGKNVWYIVKEIDRKPVSNKDYEEIKKRGDSTEGDVVLIKAVLGAIRKPESPLQNKSIILWILGLIIAGVVVYMFVGG